MLGLVVLAAACGETSGAGDSASPAQGGSTGSGMNTNSVKMQTGGKRVGELSDGWTELIDGPTAGQAKFPNTDLTKTLPAEVTGVSDLVAGRAVVFRGTVKNPISCGFIAEIKNTGGQLICGISSGAQAKGADGQVVVTDRTTTTSFAGSYVAEGAMGWRNCIGPGELGYYLSVRADGNCGMIYDQTAALTVTLTRTDKMFMRPTFRFVAESYAVGGGMLSVTMKNYGTTEEKARGSVVYMLLDEQDLPLYWDYLTIENSPVSVAPGGTFRASSLDVWFGTSTRIKTLLSEVRPNPFGT